MKYFLLLLSLITCIVSCREKPKPVHQNTHVSQKKDTIVEKELQNIYTKIADSLCAPLQVSDYKYTDRNTHIYFLNPKDSLDCFIFVSEVACGFPAGSCGSDIQVIKRKGGKYRSMLSACGYIYNTLNAQNDDILSFIYGTHDGYKVQVNWDGKEFDEENISVNNVKYEYIIRISEASHRNVTDFTLYNPKDSIDDKIPVIVEDFQYGMKRKGKLYTVMLDKSQEMYLFDDGDNPQIILSAKGKYNLRPIVSLKDIYDIMLLGDGNSLQNSQSWTYDKQKNKYLPE